MNNDNHDDTIVFTVMDRSCGFAGACFMLAMLVVSFLLGFVLTQQQLAEATGYHPHEAKRIRKCLESQGIRVFSGKGGVVWTTTECVAEAGKSPEKEVIFE